MSQFDAIINRFNAKFQQLLKTTAALKKENEQLSAELMQAKQDKEADMAALTELRQQVAILKSAAGQMNEADKAAFQKQINQHIRDIDKCIAILSE